MPKRTLVEQTASDSTLSDLKRPAPILYSEKPSEARLPVPVIRRPAPSLKDKKIELIAEAKTLIFCFPEFESELLTPLLNLEGSGDEKPELQHNLTELLNAINPIKEKIQSLNTEKRERATAIEDARAIIQHAKNLKQLNRLDDDANVELTNLAINLQAAILPSPVSTAHIKAVSETLLACIEKHLESIPLAPVLESTNAKKLKS